MKTGEIMAFLACWVHYKSPALPHVFSHSFGVLFKPHRKKGFNVRTCDLTAPSWLAALGATYNSGVQLT